MFGGFQWLFLGSFTSKCSNGGVTERLGACFGFGNSEAPMVRYRGCFNGDPQVEGPIPNGLGVRVNPDGSSYSGEWKDGFPHGQGEWKAFL